MRKILPKQRKDRLEGLCEDASADAGGRARIRFGPGYECIERLEARFGARAFSPHRHDTYAIGVTLAGVQTFSYRGETRHCLPGQCHILHPDELHDGAPGTDDGFGYRIAYIDPALIQAALGGRPLPFVPDPIQNLIRHQAQQLSPLWDMDAEITDLGRIEIAVAVADFLLLAAFDDVRATRALRLAGLLRVRDAIAAHPAKRQPIEALERLAELDRWSLARQFRSAFGTSPSRFRTLRQLHQVRRLVMTGTDLAEAALEAGFADQSHMSRQFKRAYRMTPARWAAALV